VRDQEINTKAQLALEKLESFDPTTQVQYLQAFDQILENTKAQPARIHPQTED
jgi:hypothetical protein